MIKDLFLIYMFGMTLSCFRGKPSNHIHCMNPTLSQLDVMKHLLTKVYCPNKGFIPPTGEQITAQSRFGDFLTRRRNEFMMPFLF